MADAPSFSLGLDLDGDTQLPTAGGHSDPIPAPDSIPSFSLLENDADEEFGSEQVMDSDLDARPEPPRVLKRLRRAADKSSATKKVTEIPQLPPNEGDDDIEEFPSSPEKNNNVGSSNKYHSVCSSSKVPLKGLGVLTTQSSGQWSSRKKEQASASLEARHDRFTFPKLTTSPLQRFRLLDSDSDDFTDGKGTGKGASKAPASAISEGRNDESTFPKLMVSPVRKFQLLDSDSDDPAECEGIGKGAHKIDSLSKGQESAASDQKRKPSVDTPQNVDLWKDFSPMNSSRFPTPAFDEVCKEYFQSVKDKNAALKHESESFDQFWDLDDSLPPAHRYFFHADSRVQKLVHSRLTYFSQLVMNQKLGNQQANVSNFDYMNQLSRGESSKQRGSRNASDKNCSKGRRNRAQKSNAEETTSEGWVDPKSIAAIPKNAGKRRVHASGQPAGHWYTSPEGRKIYVSRSGQELSGQMAYRHYRKESGAGFRKSKKKSNAKKRKG